MPSEHSFLKDACQITEAKWAALAERDGTTWQLRATYQVSRPMREALMAYLARPAVDAWMCGAVNVGRPRSRMRVPELKHQSVFVFPIANSFSVLLVGAEQANAHFRSVWKLVATLLGEMGDEEGVTLLQSELLLPNLQAESPYDVSRLFNRILRMFVKRSRVLGGWLALAQAGRLDVKAQWNSSLPAGMSFSIDENLLWRRVNVSLRPLLVEAGQEEWERVPREAIRSGARAWGCFPLLIGQRMIGAITLWRQRPFTDEQILALDNLSAQVAPVIEIVMTFTAMVEHLRRLAVLNDFALTVASAQNLDQITRRVFALLARIFRTERMALYLLSVDESMLREYHNREGKIQLDTAEARGHRLMGLLESGKTVRLADVTAVGFLPIYPESVSVLFTPLRYRGRTIGALILESPQPNAFSVYDEHLLVVMASHLAGLVEYGRLREEAEGRARNLGLIHEVVQQVIGLTDKREIAQITADLLTQYFSYDLAMVLLVDREYQPMVCGFSGRNATHAERAFARNPQWLLEGLLGRLVRHGESVLINDVSAEAEYRPLAGTVPGSLMCVALREGGQTLGLVEVERREKNAFRHHDLLDLESLAGILAGVVSGADQYQHLQETIRQLRAAQVELQERIQAQRSAEARLIQAAKMAAVGEMAAGVAHELNNPLTTVTGFVELVLSELPPDAPFRPDLELVLREAHRAGDVVRRLLDFARQTEMVRTRADLNEVIEDVIALTNHLIHTSGVILTTELAPQLPRVTIDRNQMKQVFLNLIHNALQAMPAGGKLILRSRRAVRDGREWVTATVRDTGHGIPPEYRDRIFEPFFTTKADQGGTGLGLSVTYGIVTDHGGMIEVESQPGKGSSFTVWLPVS